MKARKHSTTPCAQKAPDYTRMLMRVGYGCGWLKAAKASLCDGKIARAGHYLDSAIAILSSVHYPQGGCPADASLDEALSLG